jgi:DNA-binding transcriptional LysR family regulator
MSVDSRLKDNHLQNASAISHARGPMMFNWDDLRSFIEVTRTSSLSRAASKLGLNHTTVARRIHALEECLGVLLFDKAPAGYRLTENGRQLLRYAEQVESSCISAQELFGARNSKLTGTVRISVPEAFGGHFVVKHLGDFCKQYPGIELEIVASNQSLSISKRETDMAISYTRPSTGSLIVSKLTDYTLRIYGARGYLARSSPVENMEDLKRHSLIGNIDDLNSKSTSRVFYEMLPDTPASLRFKSMNAQLAAVEAELGLSPLPCYMAGGRENLVAVLPHEAKATRTFWIAKHEDMRHVRRVTALWNWLRDTVAAHQSVLLGK